MGHVDHGKTSLLDAIKSTNVVMVSQVELLNTLQLRGKNKVWKDYFIDTPGHEAFTAMRSKRCKHN